MRALIAIRVTALAVVASAGLVGCSGWDDGTNVADLDVGDCLRLGGTPDRPLATKAECGSSGSSFKVVSAVTDRAQCPADVDSSYSMRNSFNGANNTVCLDVDWVIGGCMSVDPSHDADPVRVDCDDASVPHRQRATQILRDLHAPVSVDQCASGMGYTYPQQRFVVCVEDVTS
ncbi:LppU family putative lipoprotein [Mycobacterium spongiae]|uniref:Lipoprotein LppU n=1 Tax=Mycobacterium spongiae TaxID=886343 RepID=A0A975PWC6_9MYCO|nr:hypothetical protein [Mycobacterium spongiae]QUR67015.1 hypothetical protein F6B93_07795 [Mycobacterium spongiae]